MTKVVPRKANWISRKGHTALVIMGSSSIFGKSLVTTPKMMQETDLEVGYTSFTSGLSELEQLGLLTRGDVRREYDNGMAPRTFKGSKSQNILRDIQKELVIGNLFMELPMVSKKLTMMVEPGSGTATWVDSAAFGTNSTNGAEQTTALTEVTFSTLKLAVNLA